MPNTTFASQLAVLTRHSIIRHFTRLEKEVVALGGDPDESAASMKSNLQLLDTQTKDTKKLITLVAVALAFDDMDDKMYAETAFKVIAHRKEEGAGSNE